MDAILNENQVTIVQIYKYEKPLIHKKDSKDDECIRDCYYVKFHKFDHE